MKQTWYFFVFTFLLLTACNEDAVKEEEPFLVSVQFPVDWVSPVYLKYILASDENGKIIASSEVNKDGIPVILKSNTYNGKTITLSILSIHLDNKYYRFMGTSFYDISVGSKHIVHGNANGKTFQFNFKGIDKNANHFLLSSTNGRGEYFNSTTENYLLKNISTTSTRLFISKFDLNNEIAGYYFPSTNYSEPGIYDLNLDVPFTPFNKEIVGLNNQSYVSAIIYGHLEKDNFLDPYFVSMSTNNNSLDKTKLNIYHAGNNFPSYSSTTSFTESGQYYYNSSTNKLYSFDKLKVEADVTFHDTSVNYTIQGEANILNFSFNNLNNANDRIEWDIFTRPGNNKVVLIPEIPEEISNKIQNFNKDGWKSTKYTVASLYSKLKTIDDFISLDGSIQDIKSLNFGSKINNLEAHRIIEIQRINKILY